MQNIEYSIIGGPSWADLKESTFQGLDSKHLSKVTFRIKPYRRDINLRFKIIEETIQPSINYVGREDATGLGFCIQISVEGGSTFIGYYHTGSRTGHLNPGKVILQKKNVEEVFLDID